MRKRSLSVVALAGILVAPSAALAAECTPTLRAADRRARIQALVRVTDALYVASGAALTVFDISDRAAPVERGYVNLDALAVDVAVVDAAAVVLTLDGLVFVDASDLDAPVVAGTWPMPREWGVDSIAVRGRYAFVPADGALRVVDFADPGNPTQVGTLAMPDVSDVVVASAQRAYAVADESLVTVDIADVTTLSIVSTVEIPTGRGRSLALSTDGGRVAVWGNWSSGHQNWASLDLAQLAAADLPEFRFSDDAVNKYIHEVTLDADRAYVDEVIWDVADLTAPAVVGELLGAIVRGQEATGNPELLYVADQRGLLVEDVSAPVSPQLVRSFLFPGTSLRAYVAGSTAVVLDDWGLRTFDAGAVGALDPLGDLRRPAVFPSTLLRVGDHALCYEYESPEGHLLLVDLSDPIDPVPGATIPSTSEHATADGSLVYVVREAGGAEVYDLGDPASPLLLSELPLENSGYEFDLTAHSDRFYLWTIVETEPILVQQLATLDLSDPTQPQPLGAAVVARHRGASIARGSYLVLAESEWLAVVDASNPVDPAEVGQTPLPASHFSRSVALYGSRLAVTTVPHAEPDIALSPTIVDVSRPDSPTVLGRVPTVGTADGVALGPGVLVVADGEAGVSIFDSCTPFADGFESGDASEWSLMVP